MQESSSNNGVTVDGLAECKKIIKVWPPKVTVSRPPQSLELEAPILIASKQPVEPATVKAQPKPPAAAAAIVTVVTDEIDPVVEEDEGESAAAHHSSDVRYLQWLHVLFFLTLDSIRRTTLQRTLMSWCLQVPGLVVVPQSIIATTSEYQTCMSRIHSF